MSTNDPQSRYTRTLGAQVSDRTAARLSVTNDEPVRGNATLDVDTSDV